MVPIAKRAATAALAGAALSLTLVFCSAAGAEPETTTSVASAPTTTVAIATTTTTTTVRPAPPVTAPRRIVMIGTAETAQSSTATQGVDVQPVAVPAPRTLPHTGTATLPLALLGFALVGLGAAATHGRHPQLILLQRS